MKRRRASKSKRLSNSPGGGARLLATLVVVITSMIVLVGFCLLVWLGYSATRSQWLGVEPLRILVIEKNQTETIERLASIHIMPDRSEVVVVETPLQAEIPVAGGYGRYRVEALPSLGELEGLGDKILIASVGRLLGVQFQRVIYKEVGGGELAPLDTKWISNLAQVMWRQHIAKPAYFYDDVKGARLMRNFANRKLSVVEFDQVGLLHEVDVVEGVTTQITDELRLNAILAKDIVATDKALSQISVVMENTTSHPGLAAYWGRFVAHAGFDVLRLIDGTPQLDQNQIIFISTQLEESTAGKVLKQVFPHAQVQVADTSEYRSDVVIQLGESAWRKVATRDAFE